MAKVRTELKAARIPVDLIEHIVAYGKKHGLDYTGALIALVRQALGLDKVSMPETQLVAIARRMEAIESALLNNSSNHASNKPLYKPLNNLLYGVSDESPYIDHVVAYDETYDASYDVSNYVDSVLANTDEYDVAYYERNTQSVPLNGHSADENQGSARNLNNDDHDEHILPEGADWTWEPIDYRIHAWGRFCIRGHNDQSDRALRNTSPKNKKCVVCNRMDSKAGKKNAALRAETKGAEFADTLEQDAALGETEGLAS